MIGALAASLSVSAWTLARLASSALRRSDPKRARPRRACRTITAAVAVCSSHLRVSLGVTRLITNEDEST